MPANGFIAPFDLKLDRLIEGGNVGGNYRAKWLDVDVAVKLFVLDASTTTFADEVAAWHQLRHPNVISCTARAMSVTTSSSKRGKYRTPWKFLYEAALGLAYLHERKIVHGNLCSNSILIGSDGLAKLADFGVSGLILDGYGSVRWQSPEQVPRGRIDDDSICKMWKAEWNADNDFYSPAQSGLVVQMLERLAAQEFQGQQRVQSNPEPLEHIDDYKCGDLFEEQKLRREEQHAMQMKAFVSVSQTLIILDELKTEDERNIFVAFLKREIDCHSSAYSAGQLTVLKKAHADISARLQSDAVVSTPKWFLPWYELEFDGASYLAEGAFGTVYRAKWLESDVVVKQLKRTKSSDEWADDSLLASTPETDSKRQARTETREMFDREVKYASNGSLDKYLRKIPMRYGKSCTRLPYLHSRGQTHRDLKCNNIVVGGDNKAKVTDFGLSSANVVTGAWRWVAPECLKEGSSALSLASDIYAFGMCIVEALRVVEIAAMKDNQNGRTPLPWGILDNCAVKHRVTVFRELPCRPQICTKEQWELVKRMCAYERADRIKISTVVDELAALTDVDSALEPEPESAKLSREQVAGLFEGMKRCCRLENPGALSTNQVVLRSVYGLLWDRLKDLCATGKCGSGVFDQIEALVGRARVSTQRLEQCPETLTAFTENAMNGYALHRELDKAVDATSGELTLQVEKNCTTGGQNATQFWEHQGFRNTLVIQSKQFRQQP
ncbi:hypothetical protein PHYSODRAFT_335410 [Phytophthora sojae]|uniref:Protein kinase domain-containing protein n=1 Tax=Phytophthora sojae (strain P6497) TaxID=1094619 RepID=G4ZV35_PHYSP|nr:hypothetical protein PHYSODRAFT_335410 [Phytophthora sojae]EGZ13659.1 hypothetical protein PHYSODRAFT_335410 [Phytophthora sojae]|eukprot:XP_009531088.1 hypothetical protein PHYSODRAFT_335410 [Phytophthora sojae]